MNNNMIIRFQPVKFASVWAEITFPVTSRSLWPNSFQRKSKYRKVTSTLCSITVRVLAVSVISGPNRLLLVGDHTEVWTQFELHQVNRVVMLYFRNRKWYSVEYTPSFLSGQTTPSYKYNVASCDTVKTETHHPMYGIPSGQNTSRFWLLDLLLRDFNYSLDILLIYVSISLNI